MNTQNLASLWENRQSAFLTQSADSLTVYYKPERTGEVAVFDSFFQEGTNPADPTSIGTGTAGEIILLSDNNDYYVISSPTIPEPWSVDISLYIDTDPGGKLFVLSGSSGEYVTLDVVKRLSYSLFYITLSVDNNVIVTQSFSTSSNGDYFSYDTWYDFNLTKSGSTYTLTYPGGSGNVVDGKNIQMSNMDSVSLLARPDGSSPLYGGALIKGVRGDAFMFGLAYTDIGETTPAVVNDSVASVINTGSVGGSFVQSTAGNRAILYTGSDNTSTLSETTPTPITVTGKVHLDLHGSALSSTEEDQKLLVGKFAESDTLFTCLLSDVQTSTNPDPIKTIFDESYYIVVEKDGDRYEVIGVKPRGMNTAFIADVFLKKTNKEI